MSAGIVPEPAAVATALRVMAATSLCLVIGQWLHLDLPYLSLFSAHIVMSQYTITSFQKGVERIVGRSLGVGYGLLLLALFREVPLVFLLLLIAWQIAAFYLYASGHLAYSAMQAGVFAPTVAQIGMTGDVVGAVSSGGSIMVQVILGVTAATLVNGLTGAENTITLDTRGQSLTPLRWDWISSSVMLTTMAMLTLFVTILLALPVVPTMVSAMILGMAPDTAALERKAEQRLLAVLGGGCYGFLGLLLLARIHSFGLLLTWNAFGMFLASYVTRASAKYSYVGLQTGLLLPMVLVGSSDDFGSMEPAVERFIGVILGSAVSFIVEILWPPVRTPAAASS